MKEKNLIPNENPTVKAEGNNRRLTEGELEKVNGGMGGFGQDDKTNNGDVLPNPACARVR